MKYCRTIYNVTYVLLALIILAAPDSYADSMQKNMHISPEMQHACQHNISVPPSFIKPDQLHPTNNLRRKNGEYFTAMGSYIELRGTVRDVNCVPIQNARIHIWHRDHNGGHLAEYKAVKKDIRLHPDYDKHFGYSGVTTTDNRGYFAFISVMPGISGPKDQTHINIEIQHDSFETLRSRVYLIPNSKDGNFLYDTTSIRPFRYNKAASFMHPPGETATSDAIITPNKREGLRFYSGFVLKGKESYRQF